MLKKRIIFTLLYHHGSFMLSRNFQLQKVGDLQWLQSNYDFSKVAFSIDELVILDVSRGERNADSFHDVIKKLAIGCFVPITAGGGIRDLNSAQKLLQSGADKVILNTAIAQCPNTIEDIATEYGRQCVVASVDVKTIANEPTVLTDNATTTQRASLKSWIEYVLSLPVGELYLNSIDRDGTGQGYHTELLEYLPKSFQIPLILAGGAGNAQHFALGLNDTRVDAVATAHLFNFVGDGLIRARQHLLNQNYKIANWENNSLTDIRGGATDTASTI